MQGRTSSSDEALARAHDRLLTNDTLQFDRVGFDPPAPPGWLRWIGELMQTLGPALQWAFWIGLALLAGLLLYAIGREILRLRAPGARPEVRPSVETAWRPDEDAARNLLAEADALAGRGLYAEAAHLLLLRSVEDVEKRQPRALRVSLTTREIASHKIMPDAARPAFALIGSVVERSLFGGAAVGAADFVACRQAYEAFALPEGWRR